MTVVPSFPRITMFGKEIRLRRLLPPGGRRLFSVPLDHSVSMGPIEGLESTADAARELQAAGVDLLIVTKGAVRDVAPGLTPSTMLGVHVSASTSIGSTSHRKVRVGTAAEAVALGADLLSVQVNFGVPEEPEMLRDLGEAVDECRALGLPILCMAYVKKPGTPTPEDLRHAARASADLGADLVKTTYPGSPEEFRRLVERTPVPVLIGGGVKLDDEPSFFELIRDSLSVGGAGICIGRNLFQRRPVGEFARRVAAAVHSPG